MNLCREFFMASEQYFCNRVLSSSRVKSVTAKPKPGLG